MTDSVSVHTQEILSLDELFSVLSERGVLAERAEQNNFWVFEREDIGSSPPSRQAYLHDSMYGYTMGKMTLLCLTIGPLCVRY
jgi:hypothetical protein